MEASFLFLLFFCVRGGKRVPILSRSATPAVKEGSDSRGKQKNKKHLIFFGGELCKSHKKKRWLPLCTTLYAYTFKHPPVLFCLLEGEERFFRASEWHKRGRFVCKRDCHARSSLASCWISFDGMSRPIRCLGKALLLLLLFFSFLPFGPAFFFRWDRKEEEEKNYASRDSVFFPPHRVEKTHTHTHKKERNKSYLSSSKEWRPWTAGPVVEIFHFFNIQQSKIQK